MDDRIKGYAAGIFEIARGEGLLDKVQNELLQIAGAFQTSPELRDALSDPRLPPDRKHSIIGDLFGGRADDLTVAIVGLVVDMGRASSLPAIVDELAETAAASVEGEVAEIRSAVDLDRETVDRLVAALARLTGKRLEPKVIVDPSLIGGVSARVGDTVIDGTVRKRFSGVREALQIK